MERSSRSERVDGIQSRIGHSCEAVNGLVVLAGEALEAMPIAELNNPGKSLLENRGVHLGCAEDTVFEGDRYLLDLKAKTVGGILHLDLEGIAFEVYFGEYHRL